MKVLVHYSAKLRKFIIEAQEGPENGRVIARAFRVQLKNCAWSKNRNKTAGILGECDESMHADHVPSPEAHFGPDARFLTEAIFYNWEKDLFLVNDDFDFSDEEEFPHPFESEAWQNLRHDPALLRNVLPNPEFIFLETGDEDSDEEGAITGFAFYRQKSY